MQSHQENKYLDSTSPSFITSSSSRKKAKIWTHDVFPSFRGEDVRKNFLSHIRKEFRRKGITPFIDNEIKRGESIGPELINAIRRSKIAVVLLSKYYASSKWCLEELVEIIKCKQEFGQTVFVIFYETDPSHVKNLTGEFGDVFEKTCYGKTKEETERWRRAFAEVAKIAGYDSRNWDDEAVMIEEIVNEISKRLISSTPSKYFEGLVGMESHMNEMKSLLCLGSNEVRMIGIWGPSGIGKTTIARVTHDQISGGFQLSVFMDIKSSYTRPNGSDDYNAKLHLEQQFLSQLIKQEDIKIPHLGAAHGFLMNKKVLVVLDGVDQLVQLLSIPKARCFGPGTRVIITTQDLKLLNAFKIKHIYSVDFPSFGEALQIFCINAFGQDTPYDGFEKLAREVTILTGELPLGLRVIGSHFRGMSKQEWKRELPRLRIRLDGEIGSVLKFSYDAFDDDDKSLFLHIACFFNEQYFDGDFKDIIGPKFSDVWQGFRLLIQRSLISQQIIHPMHNLLIQLGREIVRNQSIHDPGKRQFLVDSKEICEVLSDNTGSRSVIGINFDYSKVEEDQYISEKAFEEMSSLQYLRFHRGYGNSSREILHFPHGLNYLPPKLRLLDWDDYPMTCLPSKLNMKFLVKIKMEFSKLEKLWEGTQPLSNLKLMDMNNSKNLKELPDLSTATNLRRLDLINCESLVELPFSVGNLISLEKLYLSGCSSLVKFPSSIGNIKCLTYLNMSSCSSLVELPFSIGNVVNLGELDLSRCSSLMELPSSVWSMANLRKLDLNECSSLVELPSLIGKVAKLEMLYIKDSPSLVELPYGIGNLANLCILHVNHCSNLVELPSSIGNAINLETLDFSGCSGLVKLPSSIGNMRKLIELNLKGCSSLLEIPSSIGNLHMLRNFFLKRCSKLVVLPINVNLVSLEALDVTGCSQLISFPEISTNIKQLKLCGTSVKEVPLSITSWSRLDDMCVTYWESLGEFPHALGFITELELNNANIKEFPPWVNEISRLRRLVLNDCSKLVSLPELPGSLSYFYANNCESLERLSCSFTCPYIYLNFTNCWKLNERARDIIIQTPSCRYAVLPGREVPAFFSYRSTSGNSLSMNLKQRAFPASLKFKACILLVNKGDKEAGNEKGYHNATCTIVDKHKYTIMPHVLHQNLPPFSMEHLYTFDVHKDCVSGELFFKFSVEGDEWEIVECGIRVL